MQYTRTHACMHAHTRTHTLTRYDMHALRELCK